MRGKNNLGSLGIIVFPSSYYVTIFGPPPRHKIWLIVLWVLPSTTWITWYLVQIKTNLSAPTITYSLHRLRKYPESSQRSTTAARRLAIGDSCASRRQRTVTAGSRQSGTLRHCGSRLSFAFAGRCGVCCCRCRFRLRACAPACFVRDRFAIATLLILHFFNSLYA